MITQIQHFYLQMITYCSKFVPKTNVSDLFFPIKILCKTLKILNIYKYILCKSYV